MKVLKYISSKMLTKTDSNKQIENKKFVFIYGINVRDVKDEKNLLGDLSTSLHKIDSNL
jgi:hypothetical protein